MDRYVMKYPDGRYVYIDKMSGGYPFPTWDSLTASRWATAEDAARYRGISDSLFTIHKIMDIVTEPVVEGTVQTVVFHDPVHCEPGTCISERDV